MTKELSDCITQLLIERVNRTKNDLDRPILQDSNELSIETALSSYSKALKFNDEFHEEKDDYDYS